MSYKSAIYPGTFDPITLGHLDVVKKAGVLFDKLYIAVAEDTPKKTLFSRDERVEIINHDIKKLDSEISNKVEVVGFNGLLIDFASKNNVGVIVRGLRAVSDFEYEFQLASMNSRLRKEVQTIFIPASENKHFIASNLVKEVARLGGDVSEFVTEETKNLLHKKFK